MKNITIIGGSDGFGKWLALFVKKELAGAQITVTGRNTKKLEELEKSYGLCSTTDNIQAVKKADLVIFSVPIAFTEQVIAEVAPHVRNDAVLMDVTSIKGFPTAAMEKYAPKGALIIPCHPMFGPYIATIAGQIIVLTASDETQKDARYQAIYSFLQKQGAKLIETTAKEHDRMMAVVQGLTHFDMFVLGETIHKLGISVANSMQFVSPIYKLMISSVARYVGQNPELYADIQMYNPEVLEVHKHFMQVTERFNGFVKEKNKQGFVDTIRETKKYFGEETEKGQNYTDKIIYLLGAQDKLIHSSIGNTIQMKHIYTEEIITGTLEKYEDNQLLVNGSGYDANIYILF